MWAGLLSLSTVRVSHSIAVCYLHFASEENPEYLSHVGKLGVWSLPILGC